MAETRTPILSLDTLVDREFILIDGKPYELSNQGEFSVIDHLRITKKSTRVQTFLGKEEDLSEPEVEELTEALDFLCALILRAPKEVQSKLSQGQKLLVVEAFIQLLRNSTAPPAGAEEVAPRSIGESSSQG